MTDADVAAMQRLAAGEDLALNEIMARWQQRVAAFLLQMTDNRATACDLALETFVRLYHSRDRYRPTASFPSYILRIAANLARDHHRWRTRRPEQPLDLLREEGFDFADAAPTPDESLANAETMREVKHALRELPNELRESLVLSVYHGLSYDDIATVAECSSKAVETRIYRARRMLKEKLAHLSAPGASKTE